MPRSTALAHIVRQPDGSAEGVWGLYVLRSAFQPIFAFDQGKLSVAAFEGLIRPFRDGEPIPPATFFRNIPVMDRLHVETLTRTLHLLNAGACLDPSTSLFINFDPSLFSDREIVDAAIREMRLVLHESGVAPGRIVCEVTEQKSASSDTLRRFVGSLRASGFRIAVDDYGADDSDFERIEDLRPDIVKFDAQWITRLMESGPGFALLQAMVTTFHDRGITTVFEGIEEPWQLDLAEKAGASMVQGYVLARPELAPTSFSVFSRREDRFGTTQGTAPHRLRTPQPIGRDAAPVRAFGRRMPGR